MVISTREKQPMKLQVSVSLNAKISINYFVEQEQAIQKMPRGKLFQPYPCQSRWRRGLMVVSIEYQSNSLTLNGVNALQVTVEKRTPYNEAGVKYGFL